MSHSQTRAKHDRGQSQSGQIVVEYVLLLVVGVSIAFLITNLVISRNPDDPGFLVMKWREIIETIASDKADDI